eukprot:scaffold27285_cov95-Skeletonema_marinoi.AAC.1
MSNGHHPACAKGGKGEWVKEKVETWGDCVNVLAKCAYTRPQRLTLVRSGSPERMDKLVAICAKCGSPSCPDRSGHPREIHPSSLWQN